VEKINFKGVADFSARKTIIQRTTKDHQLTTNSPQKTIRETQVFPEPPSKTPANPQNLVLFTEKTFLRNQGFF
jgi:hypothetical protein